MMDTASAVELLALSESRRELHKILFRASSKIACKRDACNSQPRLSTTEQEEFWHFCNKFFVKRQTQGNSQPSRKAEEDISKKVSALEQKYNCSFSIYLSVFEKDSDSYPNLTANLLRIAHEAFLFFLDFLDHSREEEKRKVAANRAALPIYQYRHEIINAVQQNSVTIISGDTGCGKSTQVPQYLHEAGFSRIACTQPRRIACISLAHRVALESGKEYGRQVGYQIRFERAAASGNSTEKTEILFLTEGVLIKQLSPKINGKRQTKFDQLSRYDLIILDEVHERHLVADFLLALLRQIVQQRRTRATDDERQLKIVLMSATINIDLFASYFQGAPVVTVPGRLFPVELFYRPTAEKSLQGPSVDRKDKTAGDKEKRAIIDPSPYIRILQLIDKKFGTMQPKTNNADDKFTVKSAAVYRFEGGDVLIFLSGSTEIDIVVGAARHYAEKTRSWIVLPLHSALTVEEQERVARAPHGIRKCIISTNIAETSVTIDGIRFVIDSGKAKEMAYDPATRLQRLKEKWVSKASAEQRRGRAGRTGPGVCYRLYEESYFDSMQPYNVPEIRRVPLENLLLEMLTMHLTLPKKVVNFVPSDEKAEDVDKNDGNNEDDDFQFIEAPDTAAAHLALSSLVSHRAVELTQDVETRQAVLTPLGALLAQLPVEVQIGKFLIFGTLISTMYLNETADDIDDKPDDARSLRMRAGTTALVAILSTQSMLTQRALRDRECRAKLETAVSEHGDMLTLLNIYEQWLHMKQGESSNRSRSSGNSSRNWCNRRGVNEQRLYEVSKLRWQFNKIIASCMKRIVRRRRTQRQAVGYHERSKRKQLLSLRDKARHQRLHRRPKELKAEFDAGEGDAAIKATDDSDAEDEQKNVDDEDEFNLDDIEFQMRSSAMLTNDILPTHRDELRMMHFAIAMALYPNFAVADELNTLKSDSEQIYHTKSKLFLLMHPSSIFAIRPQLVQLISSDEKIQNHSAEGDSATGNESANLFECEPNERQRRLRRMWNTSHSIIVYERVLETRKPYLLNCARAPLLHTCMLCCAQVDVIVVGSGQWRVIFDRWLSVHILWQQQESNGESCDDTMTLFFARALRLRCLWTLLQKSLTSVNLADDVENRMGLLETAMLRHFRHQLLIFMDSQILYAVNKVLPAESKVLYKDAANDDAEVRSGLDGESQVMDEGGFTYNVLMPSASSGEGEYAVEDREEKAVSSTCPYCKDILEGKSVCGIIRHCSACGLEERFPVHRNPVTNADTIPSQEIDLRASEAPLLLNESSDTVVEDHKILLRLNQHADADKTDAAEQTTGGNSVCEICGEEMPSKPTITELLRHRKSCRPR